MNSRSTLAEHDSLQHASMHGAERAVLDLSRDALVAVAPDGRVLFWNGGAARMFGHAPEVAVGADFAALVAPAGRACCDAARDDALRDGHWEGRLELARRDGTPLVVLCRWQAERDDAGRIVRLLVAGTDIRLWQRVVGDQAGTAYGAQRQADQDALLAAIEAGQLLLHFQPRLDLRTDGVAALEALVRWDHPDGSLLGPDDFIPLAEESGLIDALGAWVLRAACRQLRAWSDAGLAPPRLAVNVSAVQLRGGRLPELVAEVLADSGLPPQLLEIELTESSLAENLDAARRTLAALRRLGVQLSIDDFGTGYSSLAYLKRLPVQMLKIDRSFIRDLAVDEDDAAIVSSTIAMAHRMRLRVVAEGVTSFEQMRFLKSHGCDEVQGFLLCEPLPPDQTAAWLETRLPRDGHRRPPA